MNEASSVAPRPAAAERGVAVRVSVGFGVGPFRVSQTLLRTGGRRRRRRARRRPVYVKQRRRTAPVAVPASVQAAELRAQAEARREARWGHLPVAERPLRAMTVRQAWQHKPAFRVTVLVLVGFWALGSAISGPPSLLLMGPLWVWLFYRHQQATKATAQAVYDAEVARVGTFDVERAAREAEAFGLPSEVFRMTQTPAAPNPTARGRHSA